MSDDILAYASVLRLSRNDIKTLKIKDAYSLHKTIYGLFEDVRNDAAKQASESSGILWVDKGGDFHSRQILLLSDRKPHQTPQFGEVESKIIRSSFVEHETYGFEITLNPSKRNKNTGKIESIRKRDDIMLWAIERAQKSWGFEIHPNHLQVQINPVLQFDKSGKTITHNSAFLKGELRVTDQQAFTKSITHGIGRGKAFGFGLLQIVPLQPSIDN
jgi:CRISPR system Cascade subunit CasE